ncbi:MAG: hypothetical protein QG608_557 [Actinomycetota bacterium]|nr:hypothetical protein [Actinomycetota bacterium]
MTAEHTRPRPFEPRHALSRGLPSSTSGADPPRRVPLHEVSSGEPAPLDTARGSAASEESLVRPFLMTGGRTGSSSIDLRVETLIQTRPDAQRTTLRFEAQQIVLLCRHPTSIAEVAAALHVPLGVARVLVCDLVEQDQVTVFEREELSIQLIERVRARVRAL